MNITCFDDFVESARKLEKKTVIAVAEAGDEHTLESVIEAADNGVMIPKLIGNKAKIEELLIKYEVDPSRFDIISTQDRAQSMTVAINMINSGEATALMKGQLESADFLKPIVNKDNGLLTGGQLSLAGFFALPTYHKIFSISDMGLNTYPDLNVKKAITENAVGMLNAVGLDCPKVAILAAVEKVNPKMPETVDADALKKMNQNGEIKNCIIEGPISFDLATSPEAARIKGYDSPVAGDADLLIVPDVVSGNILAKGLTGMAGALTAGTVLGAKIPIIFTSRSAETADKYYSIALTACVAAGMLK